MKKRVGETVYWLFSVVAFFLVCFAAYALVQALHRGSDLTHGFVFLALAVLAWFVGRLCEYVLDGL
jgi:hypothetical protein